MTPDLEALVVAAYVFADDYRVPARPGPRAKINDAELVALAVCQAAMGISSDRQFLGLVGYRLPGWFTHLPEQSQYNRRLRALTGLLTVSDSPSPACHWPPQKTPLRVSKLLLMRETAASHARRCTPGITHSSS